MGIYYIVAFVLLFVGLKFNRHGYLDDNLSIAQTNTIKGFFILLVFISHYLIMIYSAGYDSHNFLDKVADYIQTELGQLIVTMFFFYSGYGVMESLKDKGHSYIISFPKNRILTTLLNYDFAVFVFILLSVILGIHLEFKDIFFSLFAWKSVGNSNWYIFSILACYSAFFFAGLLFSYNPKRMSLFVLAQVLVIMIALSFKKQPWWYDTILCFPLGVYFSVFKTRIIPYIQKHFLLTLLFLVLFFVFFHFHKEPTLRGITSNLQGAAFALIVVLLSMKIKTGNVVLNWLGVNLFPIYIYQRIPMIIISNNAGNSFLVSRPHFCFLICLVVTLAIAWSYRYWRIKLA